VPATGSGPVGLADVPGHVLEQTSAGEDVDGLEATADADDRDAPGLRCGPRPGLQLVTIGLDVPRATVRLTVANRIDVCSARQQQPVHRCQRLAPGGLVARRIEGDGLAPVAADRVEVELVLARGQVRLGLSGGDGQGHDDLGSIHRPRIASRDDGRVAAVRAGASSTG
jgi:hypothetical protein